MTDKEKETALALSNASREGDATTIYTQLLDKFFLASLADITKDVKTNAIKELKEWVLRTFTYQWDFKNISFSNLNKKQNELIEEYNFNNRMVNKHLINTRIKLQHGQSVMALRVGKGKLLPEVLELIGTPKQANGEWVEVFATKNNISQHNEQEQLTFYKFYKNNTEVFVQTYLAPFNDEVKKNPSNSAKDEYKNGKAYKYPKIDYLPLEIFYANETATPEWDFVANSINIAGTFNEQLFTEWKYIRTQLINNINFNPTKTANDVKDDIENKDKRVHDMYDPDGEINQAISYLSSGGITVDIAKGVIEFYKDQIKEFLFMISRTGGGNNKHTTEAMNDNVNAYSYIWTKKTLLSEELSRFYFKLLDISKKYNFISIDELPTYLKGEIQLSRSLEILLNLNADGKEKDNETQEFVQTQQGGNKNNKGASNEQKS